MQVLAPEAEDGMFYFFEKVTYRNMKRGGAQDPQPKATLRTMPSLPGRPPVSKAAMPVPPVVTDPGDKNLEMNTSYASGGNRPNPAGTKMSSGKEDKKDDKDVKEELEDIRKDDKKRSDAFWAGRMNKTARQDPGDPPARREAWSSFDDEMFKSRRPSDIPMAEDTGDADHHRLPPDIEEVASEMPHVVRWGGNHPAAGREVDRRRTPPGHGARRGTQQRTARSHILAACLRAW